MDKSKLEETIKGIEYCMGANTPDDCEHCPGQYICGDSIMQENFVDLPKNMINNALELLKEQAEEIEHLKRTHIVSTGSGMAIGAVHGGMTIKKEYHQQAKEVYNIGHIDRLDL